MRKPSRTAIHRAALYLAVSVAGMAVLIGLYCLVSGRSLGEALGNLWIALLIAFAVAVATAFRDEREEDRADSTEPPQQNQR